MAKVVVRVIDFLAVVAFVFVVFVVVVVVVLVNSPLLLLTSTLR